MAKTSDRVSSIAARYADTKPTDLSMMTAKEAEPVARDIRSMAASLLRQDEVKGLRGLVRKVLGK